MKLYVLRATQTIWYDCPDEGMQDLGECYEDVEFSSMPDELNRKAAELTAGHTQNPGGFWNETRATTLRTLHANYDNTEYVYSVVDVSDLLSSI